MIVSCLMVTYCVSLVSDQLCRQLSFLWYNSCLFVRGEVCGDAFPIEGVLVVTYVLSAEALLQCRCGVAN